MVWCIILFILVHWLSSDYIRSPETLAIIPETCCLGPEIHVDIIGYDIKTKEFSHWRPQKMSSLLACLSTKSIPLLNLPALRISLMIFFLCVSSPSLDLHAWWSPPLWVILSHHERLGTQLSKGNGLFCNIPAPLPAVWLQLPLKGPSAVYGNYHCVRTLEDLSFSRTTLFVSFFFFYPHGRAEAARLCSTVGRRQENGEQLVQWGEELHGGGQSRWRIWLLAQRTALPYGTERRRGAKQNWGILWGYSRTLQPVKNITYRW